MSYFERFKSLLRCLNKGCEVERKGEIHDRMSQKYYHPHSKKRHYRVYLPRHYREGKPLPLVMVLHGCRQDHQDIQAISDFDRLADTYNFIVVYPFVTRYSDIRTRNCWGWWRPEHIKPGFGEVEDLRRIVEEVADEFPVNHRRIHIVGLSSGGGMAVAALTVHAGYFASGAVIAGVPYGESASAVALPFKSARRYRPVDVTVAMMEKARENDRTPVPICIVHSHDDATVSIKAAKNLRDSWLRYFAYDKKLAKRLKSGSTRGVPWKHTRYRDRSGKSIVETIFLSGPGHGWYGGASGRFSYPTAPPVSDMIWKFFAGHVLSTEAEELADEMAPEVIGESGLDFG